MTIHAPVAPDQSTSPNVDRFPEVFFTTLIHRWFSTQYGIGHNSWLCLRANGETRAAGPVLGLWF